MALGGLRAQRRARSDLLPSRRRAGPQDVPPRVLEREAQRSTGPGQLAHPLLPPLRQARRWARCGVALRSQESTWIQTTPTAVYKIEDSHVLSEKLFASIYLSHVSGDFTLTPEGGLDKQADLDADYVWRNSTTSSRDGFPRTRRG